MADPAAAACTASAARPRSITTAWEVSPRGTNITLLLLQALRPADREKTMVRRAAEKLRVRQRSYLALG
jgi:hypothetical protein